MGIGGLKWQKEETKVTEARAAAGSSSSSESGDVRTWKLETQGKGQVPLRRFWENWKNVETFVLLLPPGSRALRALKSRQAGRSQAILPPPVVLAGPKS